MNKLSLIIIGLFLFAALPVSAGPFLVCDPSQPAEKVDKYEVKFNGQDPVTVLPDPTGQYGFKYDLAGKPNGEYTVRANAHKSKKCSVWSTILNFKLPQK